MAIFSERLIYGHNDLSWMVIQGQPSWSFMNANNLFKLLYCQNCPFLDETAVHLFKQFSLAWGLVDIIRCLIDYILGATLLGQSRWPGVLRMLHGLPEIVSSRKGRVCLSAVWTSTKKICSYNGFSYVENPSWNPRLKSPKGLKGFITLLCTYKKSSFIYNNELFKKIILLK